MAYEKPISSLWCDEAEPADLPCLLRIARDVITRDYAPFLGTDATDSFLESGEADREIAEGLNRCLTLRSRECLLGFSILDGKRLHILMTDRAYRRRGFGSRLLVFTEQRLFRDYPEIELQSFRDNETANRFYRNNGWIEVGSPAGTADGPAMIHFIKCRPA